MTIKDEANAEATEGISLETGLSIHTLTEVMVHCEVLLFVALCRQVFVNVVCAIFADLRDSRIRNLYLAGTEMHVVESSFDGAQVFKALHSVPKKQGHLARHQTPHCPSEVWVTNLIFLLVYGHLDEVHPAAAADDFQRVGASIFGILRGVWGVKKQHLSCLELGSKLCIQKLVPSSGSP